MFASASLFQSRVEYWNTSKIRDMSVSAVLKMNTYFYHSKISHKKYSNSKMSQRECFSLLYLFVWMFLLGIHQMLTIWKFFCILTLCMRFNWKYNKLSLIFSKYVPQKMFESAILFDGSLHGWDTARVTNMGVSPGRLENIIVILFYNLAISSIPLINFKLKRMFKKATLFDGNVSPWDTSKVKDMSVSLSQHISNVITTFEIYCYPESEM